MPDIGRRLMNIHHLVYTFISDIIQFLLRFHRPKDRAEKEMFTKILSGFSFDGAKREGIAGGASAIGAGGQGKGSSVIVNDELYRAMQDRVRELEGQNLSLREIIESMRNTFDFFEVFNDQFVLQKRAQIQSLSPN